MEEEHEWEHNDDSHLGCMGCVIRWIILLLVAIVIVVILAVFGFMIGNVFSDNPCGCLMDKGITVAMR